MDPPEETTFHLEGKFDGTAAHYLWERVRMNESPGKILDFSKVDSFDDSTLAFLTLTLVLLGRRCREVRLRGLRDHQLRLLRHFGVETAGDGLVRLPRSAHAQWPHLSAVDPASR